eukprot:299786-Chlamydomonas_euryale.AAC.1
MPLHRVSSQCGQQRSRRAALAAAAVDVPVAARGRKRHTTAAATPGRAAAAAVASRAAALGRAAAAAISGAFGRGSWDDRKPVGAVWAASRGSTPHHGTAAATASRHRNRRSGRPEHPRRRRSAPARVAHEPQPTQRQV